MNLTFCNINFGPRTPNSERLVRSKGFTLIEMIVVIVVLAIVSGITIKFLVDGMQIYTMTINQKTLYDEGKLALERMCRDIRDARTITSPAGPPFPSSGSLIAFTRTNATSGDVIDENITFTLTGTTLEKVKGGVNYGIASNVTAFTITRTAPDDEIQIDLTLSLTSGEGVKLRTKVYPKNPLQSATRKNFFYCWEELRS